MTEKTIKVNAAVHQKLEELKEKYDDESFNAVLERNLGLVPEDDPNKLFAYLGDDLREAAREIVEIIDNVDDFERQVEKSGSRDVLRFVSKETGDEIASVISSENSFDVKYRSQGGEMRDCGAGYDSSSNDDISYATLGDLHSSITLEEVKESIKKKVRGANRRWGNP